MTSHYIRCLVKSSFETVFDALTSGFCNIYSKRMGNNHETRNGIILGERYFLRVNSDVAILIILQKHSSVETKVEIISCAGGAGMTEISYGAHSSYVHDVKNFLLKNGFEIEVEEEISYFGRSSGVA